MASTGRGPLIPVLVALVALLIADVVGAVVVRHDTSANAEDQKLPAAIVTDAINATVAAEPFRVAGSAQTDANARSSIDLVFTQGVSGGTLLASGQTVSIVNTPTETYVRGEASLVRSALGKRAPASLSATSWVEASAGDPEFAAFTGFANVRSFLQALTAGRFIAGKVVTFQHHRAIPLESVTNPGEVIYVAASSQPKLLAIAGKGQAGSAAFAFDEYGKATPPALPTDPIDLDKLLETGGQG